MNNQIEKVGLGIQGSVFGFPSMNTNEESIIGLLWFIIGIDIERLLRCGSILDQQPLETSHSSESYQLTGFSLSSES